MSDSGTERVQACAQILPLKGRLFTFGGAYDIIELRDEGSV